MILLYLNFNTITYPWFRSRGSISYQKQRAQSQSNGNTSSISIRATLFYSTEQEVSYKRGPDLRTDALQEQRNANVEVKTLNKDRLNWTTRTPRPGNSGRSFGRTWRKCQSTCARMCRLGVLTDERVPMVRTRIIAINAKPVTTNRETLQWKGEQGLSRRVHQETAAKAVSASLFLPGSL